MWPNMGWAVPAVAPELLHRWALQGPPQTALVLSLGLFSSATNERLGQIGIVGWFVE